MTFPYSYAKINLQTERIFPDCEQIKITNRSDDKGNPELQGESIATLFIKLLFDLMIELILSFCRLGERIFCLKRGALWKLTIQQD